MINHSTRNYFFLLERLLSSLKLELLEIFLSLVILFLKLNSFEH